LRIAEDRKHALRQRKGVAILTGAWRRAYVLNDSVTTGLLAYGPQFPQAE